MSTSADSLSGEYTTPSKPSDPIRLELFKNAISLIADEMALTVLRTSYSGVLKDNMDFSTGLTDSNGKLVALGLTVPAHLGSIPSAMEAIFVHYRNEIHPGDVFIMNDPFDGGMHLPDIFVVKPLYHAGSLAAFAATVCHHSDVGGRVAGSNAADSTEIYAEGLRLTPLKLYDKGELNSTLMKIIEKNVRLPLQVAADLRAQLAACHIAEKQFAELIARHGLAEIDRIMMGSRLMSGAGYLLKVPAIDLAEVGAGGGSHVWIDRGGALQVGPASAGAKPGPVCYDLGGTIPTITDANVILGYINPDHIAGGAVKLNADKARRVFADVVARPLGLSLEAAAYGAHLIAVSNMIRGIKQVSTERGRDPREFALFAFGGNGPLFACGMASVLGIKPASCRPEPLHMSMLPATSSSICPQPDDGAKVEDLLL